MAAAITPWIPVNQEDWIQPIAPWSSGPLGNAGAGASWSPEAKKSFGGCTDSSLRFLIG
jgi:hypothetical protein